MAQRAPAFVVSQFIQGKSGSQLSSLALTTPQANNLKAALLDDARGAIYSAIASMADAFSGLQRRHYSWATVKLYYACFYFAKASLARRGICVLYVNQKPKYLVATAGCGLQSCSGNSHTVVTSLYSSHCSGGALIAQPIGLQTAFEWITTRREEVNYRVLRFSDPDVPEWFAVAEENGLRRVVGDYFMDLPLYAYDKDHAMIALPLAALIEQSKSVLGFDGLGLGSTESVALKAFLADANGPIHHFNFL